ncbi:MAG: hypothetical protein RIQ72_341 [Candidatus Parcubacteria bacterium]
MKKYILIGAISVACIIAITLVFIKTQEKKSVLNLDNLFLSGDYDQAITKATEKLNNNESDIEALLILAANYAQKGSVSFREEEYSEKSIQYADMVIALNPKISEAFRIKGYAYEIQEKYPKAHENYDQAIVLDPKNSLAISNKAHSYDLEGRIDKAKELYTYALTIMPNNSHALLNLARLQVRENDFEGAKVSLNNLFASEPQVRFLSEGHMTLSYLFYLEGDIDSSYEHIDLAIKTDSTLPQAYVHRARLNLGGALDAETPEELNDVVTSVEDDLNSALAINPNQASAYTIFMELQLVTGDSAAQKEYQSKALQAVELDITLGKAEKESLVKYLKAKVQVIK